MFLQRNRNSYFPNDAWKSYLHQEYIHAEEKRKRKPLLHVLLFIVGWQAWQGTRVTWFAVALCSQIRSSRRPCTWGTTHCSVACSCSSTASFVRRLRNVPPSIWTRRSRADNERTATRTCSTPSTFISTASRARVEVSATDLSPSPPSSALRSPSS